MFGVTEVGFITTPLPVPSNSKFRLYHLALSGKPALKFGTLIRASGTDFLLGQHTAIHFMHLPDAKAWRFVDIEIKSVPRHATEQSVREAIAALPGVEEVRLVTQGMIKPLVTLSSTWRASVVLEGVLLQVEPVPKTMTIAYSTLYSAFKTDSEKGRVVINNVKLNWFLAPWCSSCGSPKANHNCKLEQLFKDNGPDRLFKGFNQLGSLEIQTTLT